MPDTHVLSFHHPQSSHGSCQTFPFKEATSLPGLLYVVSLTDPDMQIEYQESSASPSYPHANHPPPYVERRRKYSYPRKHCCDGSTRIQNENSFVRSVWINNLFTFKHADALCIRLHHFSSQKDRKSKGKHACKKEKTFHPSKRINSPSAGRCIQ